MGASHVDIDTEASWVRFSLQDPTLVDFRKVADVLASASYELVTIEVDLTGEVLAESGGAWLVVSGTGQRIPVEAESVDGGTRKIHAVVLGWNTDSPRLKLQLETGS